jgi:hypothetical protein
MRLWRKTLYIAWPAPKGKSISATLIATAERFEDYA